MEIKYTVDEQVLIIGSGNAGIKAALEARRNGAKVLLVSQMRFGHSGSTFYPGTPGWGCLKVNFEGDSEQDFYDEIMEAGAGVADPKLARVLVRDSAKRFDEIEAIGLPHEKTPQGEHITVLPCFAKRKRGGAIMDMDKIRRVLWENLMKSGVRVRSGVTVTNLVVKDGVCAGALAIDETDNFCFIRAGATILATGGACNLYKFALATSEQSGDGYLMGLEAGARLINLEFIQFIPGLTAPVKRILFHEKTLDHFPKITNKDGRQFVYDYLPDGVTMEGCLIERAKHGPFTNMDVSRWFDIAMYEEQRAGRTLASDGVHMSYPKETMDDTRNTTKKWLKWMSERGMDVVNEGIDIMPHAQGFNGGIYIDEHTGTGVEGLFAAGETAGGPHGADRMGGAAITATQVFGGIAGQSAAQYCMAKKSKEVSIEYARDYTENLMGKESGGVVDIAAAKSEIKDIMWGCGAIVRSEDRCKQGLARLDAIDKSFNPMAHYDAGIDIKQVSKLRSFIGIARLLLTVMEFRKESRGPHFRMDYPQTSEEYNGAIVVQSRNGKTSLELVEF
ncbi:MAG: FAD-binding protein [Clostridia bacterium]|jgi:fumarate reductase (CoM/CoB) subunit A|nr:FAD-binding protein [Clostridia bacterium]